jgi:saccharopine dehydrogenase (NAD+, L-lysine-forming)
MKTILLLGGYGRIGPWVAHWLLRETDASLIVAGRHKEKAEQLAARLNASVPGKRVTALAADAAQADSLSAALRHVQLVVDNTPTTQYTAQVARAALAASVDYLDFHYPAQGLASLRALAPDIARSGRCFISQGGFHPGLLAPLVRFVAPRFVNYQKAAIGLAMNVCGVSYTESAREFMEELGSYQGSLCRGGTWQPVGWREGRSFDFGPRFGVRPCVALDFAELRGLPELYGIQELGCYAAGFNWFVDCLVFPLGILLGKVKRGLGAAWLGRAWAWGMNHCSRPPYGVVMRLEAEGEAEGRPLVVHVVLEHADVFEFTAIPVVACLRQYLDGSIARPGLWLMGEVVEPVRLFDDLKRMGVRIETEAPTEASLPAPEMLQPTGPA